MRFLGKAMSAVTHRGRYVVTGCLVAGSIFALAACGSSSSSSSSGGSSTWLERQRRQDNRHLLEPPAPGRLDSPDQSRSSTASSSRSRRRAARPDTFTVNYQSLDDSTAQAGKWDPTQTAANARKVATDPKAVYYIGEFNSGASEVIDSDPQPGRDPAGQSGEHIRRPDHERARERTR